jgi:hypothetical protein
VRTRGDRLRTAALLLAGALAVHDLRVLVGYGEHAELILREPAHAYLPVATGLAIVLVLVAGANLARSALGGPTPRGPGQRPTSLFRSWLANSALLVAIYLTQASAESFFDPGHPIIGHGGWVVGPLALVVGFAIALASREAEHVVRRHAGRIISHITSAPVHRSLVTARPALRPRFAPLAMRGAGRAPPVPG